MKINPAIINSINLKQNGIITEKIFSETTNPNNTELPSFVDAKNFVNVNFKAQSILPTSVSEREDFFKRINTVNFFNYGNGGNRIATALKEQIAQRYNGGNIFSIMRYLQSAGRTVLEVNSDSCMVLLNNDELLSDMRINGMYYYLSIPSLTISADSLFCPLYPFFDEDDIYASFDASPVFVEHPKYLRIYGEGYINFTEPDDLRLCKKVRDESSNCYLADMDYYFRTLSEYRQRNQKLLHDINGIYYKEMSKDDLPSSLRKFPVYMNLKDGSLHSGSSEAFQVTPRLPLNYMNQPPMRTANIYGYNQYQTETHRPEPVSKPADEPQTPQEPKLEGLTTLFETEFDTDPADAILSGDNN